MKKVLRLLYNLIPPQLKNKIDQGRKQLTFETLAPLKSIAGTGTNAENE